MIVPINESLFGDGLILRFRSCMILKVLSTMNQDKVLSMRHVKSKAGKCHWNFRIGILLNRIVPSRLFHQIPIAAMLYY